MHNLNLNLMMYLAGFQIDLIDIVTFVTGIGLCLAMVYVLIISWIEKEYRAVKISGLFALVLFFSFALLLIYDFPYRNLFLIGILCLIYLVFIILLFPYNPTIKGGYQQPKQGLDERNVMFSRNELEPGTDLFNNYYSDKPELKELDDKFRERPGLLSPESTYYQAFSFASSEANLEIIEALKPYVGGPISGKRVEVDSKKITEYIKTWSKKLGVHSIGITHLKDYHLYTHKGRGELYGKEVNNKHPFAIAITVEMDNDMVQSAPQGAIVMESTQQYLNVGTIALQIALFIRNLGYDTRAHIDGNYEVICPLVARDAGLGEIGRMGLLMTPKLGPRVRIAVVTTEIPLQVDENVNLSLMIDFCGICKKCADVCPSRSISFDDRKEIEGVLRWQINSESCFTYWCLAGTDCGRCMAVCPYSHPNNLMHNFVRWGINNSYIFRRFALYMDDLFYTRRPKSRKLPSWIDI